MNFKGEMHMKKNNIVSLQAYKKEKEKKKKRENNKKATETIYSFDKEKHDLEFY